VSLDKFYEMVTHDPNAFYKICIALPYTIECVLKSAPDVQVPNDTVMSELLKMAGGEDSAIPIVLYYLGFYEYVGFSIE
jgi:hypothetical protein